MEGFAPRACTCCFTGHRPSKLPWGLDESEPACVALKERIAQELVRLYERGFRHFITGMARGSDLYFAEAVLELRQDHPDVTLEAAVPCSTQAGSWRRAERERYHAILDRCDAETLVQREYSRGCMHRRNRYMVERSAAILAVYDGTGGGTMYTLHYAAEQGLETIVIPIETIKKA